MVLEEHRPTPEEILKKIRMIDPDETRVRQGRLKIFFGYAAGVGKTYAMLEMAHQMKDMGVDVVAGYIEPHIRPATMKLVEGLVCAVRGAVRKRVRGRAAHGGVCRRAEIRLRQP